MAAIEQDRHEKAAAAVVNPTLFEPASVPAEAPTPRETAQWARHKYPDQIAAVTGSEWKVSFVASENLIQGIERARDLLASRFPQARLEDVLGVAVDLLLDRVDPKRRLERRALRAARGTANTPQPPHRKAISRPVRDSVLGRDDYRCTFAGPDGERCPERRHLELDHVVPKAAGGSDAPENLRSVCRPHNQFLARLAFGAGYIQNAIERRRAGGARDAST